MGPTGPSAGLNPGPWMGFKSYSGRGGPVGGIFSFFLPFFLFPFFPSSFLICKLSKTIYYLKLYLISKTEKKKPGGIGFTSGFSRDSMYYGG